LKPVVGALHQLGIRIVVYLDDMLLMAQSKEILKQHLATVLHTLIGLGFIVNTSKSVFTPTQELEFLGFLPNTLSMMISLSQKKVIGLKQTVNGQGLSSPTGPDDRDQTCHSSTTESWSKPRLLQ